MTRTEYKQLQAAEMSVKTWEQWIQRNGHRMTAAYIIADTLLSVAKCRRQRLREQIRGF